MSKTCPGDQQRKLIILSGPSGVGKSALKNKVIELTQADPGLPQFSMLPLLYSRRPRKNETDGNDFLFVTAEEIARYDSKEVFRRQLYRKYWQAVRLKDIEATFTEDQIRILELPRLLALDVMNTYVKIRSVLLAPISIPTNWRQVDLQETWKQLEWRQRERAETNGDVLDDAEVRLRIEEGIELLRAAHKYERVFVIPMAPRGKEREEIVTRVAREFIDFAVKDIAKNY
ncbi:MAG TPA: hypothetical protein VHH35_14865 [Pyrinomonadaceae bacterium]|nr:hypothetical protein [Pyrinomonadaceae bacterium]